MAESNGMVMCDHCDELISRSAFERHKRKRNVESQISSYSRTTQAYETDSDSDSISNADLDLGVAEDLRNTSTLQDKDLLCGNTDESGNDSDDLNAESSCDRQLEDQLNGPEHQGVLSSTDEEDGDEVWNDVLPDDLQQDLNGQPPPLPDNKENRSKNVAQSLVFWLVYFLLMWQLSCHISENGMAWLLRFLGAWLKLLGMEISNDTLSQIIVAFPGTMYMLRQILDFDRDDFDKYVVCPKCHKLYQYNECLTTVNNRQVANVCCGYLYSRGKKVACGASIVYKVQLANGNTCFYPLKYYCSNSIINALERLLQKEGFVEKCEEWRKRSLNDNEMSDIYDGKIWHDFMTVNGKDFLKAPRNYGLMLNFDFFQPMKRRKDYSVGVFYMVILNLPRAERYKWENVIVVGIIPSFSKEPKSLNAFLEPAVKELQCLWKGMKLNSALCRFQLTFRAAVISTSSDIPATRKLGGFKSHSALHGCSHCLKLFPGGFGTSRDYSGFDREHWEPRTNQHHRHLAKKIDTIKTVTKREMFCRDNGITHYSILLDLEYFDAIRCFTVDPMHNLFLGTAKKMYHLWLSNNVLSQKNMEEIEQRIKLMDVPSTIGRLPVRISSNSGCYTAEQWKNWTLLYSLFCLKGILPDDHFKCWQTFVLACKYICQTVIKKTDIEIFDGLFVKFCKEMEQLFGKEVITPNMHLHCHLKDVLLDHGPVSSFWCFSFERFNGILGSTPTNKRSVELQLMRRFKMAHFFEEKNFPDLFRNDLFHLCSRVKQDESDDWVAKSQWLDKWELHKLAVTAPMPEGNQWSNQTGVFCPHNYKLTPVDSDDAKLLLEVYRLLYPGIQITSTDMSLIMHKFGSVTVGSTTYGSKLEPRRIRSGRILASWPANCGAVNKDTFALTPGTVNYYFTHSTTIGGECVMHTFACVKWYKPAEDRNSIGNPAQVWSSEYQEGGPSSFLPVQRIHAHFATAKLSTIENNSIVVCPILRKTLL